MILADALVATSLPTRLALTALGFIPSVAVEARTEAAIPEPVCGGALLRPHRLRAGPQPNGDRDGRSATLTQRPAPTTRRGLVPFSLRMA